MEALAGVSSVLAVVSVAIQLGDGIKKLYDFWDSVIEAPQEVQAISKDLKIILDVVEDMQMQFEAQKPNSRAATTTSAALEQCLNSVGTLQALTYKLNSGLSSNETKRRKWSALKGAWKKTKIANFRESLRDMKLTLLLAKQNSDRSGNKQYPSW